MQGIRVVKSLGRSGLVFDRYDRKARPAARPRAGQGPHARAALVRLRVPPAGHPGAHPGRRLAGGEHRRADRRRAGRLRRAVHRAALADPVARAGCSPRPRRRPAPATGSASCSTTPMTVTDRPGVAPAAGRARRPGCGFEGVGFPTPAPAGPVLARRRPRHRAGRDGRPGRGHRLGQDDADRAGRPAVRRHRRPGHPRRHRRPRPAAGPAAHGRRHRVRGRDAVLDERPGEPDARPARRHRRRRRRGAAGGAGRLRARPALGPGHPDRRAGPVAVRRPAAAAGAGPRGARPPVGAGARRPAVGARRAHRGAGRARRCARCWPRTTALVVAHRASTVLLADRVALLAGGRIAAVGTHSELLADGARPTGTCWRRTVELAGALTRRRRR